MNVVCEGVSKAFGSVQALQDVSLTVNSGELFFLLGPSGCGKTTLLRCIAGFEQPERGRIFLGDEEATAVPAHRRSTAMVFQGYALWPHMTVRENVQFGLDVRRMGRRERTQRVAEALGRVQITELAERRPNELSGGQQQRVALARTLVVEPGCLLFDEPLANLDAKLRREMRGVIRGLCKETGQTAIYVTHDRGEALSMADRLAVLEDGELLQVGTPRDVYRRPVNRFVAGFIGEGSFLDGTVRLSTERDADVETACGLLHVSQPSVVLPVGAKTTICLRPEAIVRGPAEQNSFHVSVGETTYLGEMAESSLTVADGADLRMFELNPPASLAAGASFPVHVHPEDVILLPD
jgi:iron(III) transport system ATP-binding protein